MTTPALRSMPVPVSAPYPRRTLSPRAAGDPGTALPTLGVVAVARAVRGADGWAAPQPTPSRQLPDPDATCRALIQGVVEVLDGSRQPNQLVRWLSADVYAALQRRAAITARLRRRSGSPTGRRNAARGLQAAQGRPGAVSRPPQDRRAVVTSVRTSSPADGVVEACAVVVDRGRARAVAVRLEGLDRRWRVTALEIG